MLFLAAGLGLVFWLLQRDCRDECCLSFDGGNGEYLHYAHRAGGAGRSGTDGARGTAADLGAAVRDRRAVSRVAKVGRVETVERPKAVVSSTAVDAIL